MFQYRQALVRLRAGDSERDIARSGLMGRQKLAAVRELAQARGWLDPSHELPDEALIRAALGERRRAASTVSSVQSWRELVKGRRIFPSRGCGGKLGRVKQRVRGFCDARWGCRIPARF